MQIQNPDVGTIARDQAMLTISEGTPNNLQTNVIPVLDVSPDFHRVANIVRQASRSTTGTSTIYTAASDKDTYITTVFLSFCADATADNTFAVVGCTVNGVSSSRDLLRIQKLSLTAINQTVVITLPVPVKVDRGTAITVQTSFSVGSSAISAGITGYEVQK